ncbi:hypothetical protein AAC387_Pa09g0747 [Persea americana]
MEGTWTNGAKAKVEEDEAVPEENSAGDHEHTSEISLHAIVGAPTPQTMHVTGTLGQQPLVILIDSRSTHYFLDLMVARKARLVIHWSGKLEVMVANGKRLPSEGNCLDVTLTIQGLLVATDSYLLPLGGCDAVHGTHWLRTLGATLWDASDLWMKFTLNGTPYHFKGELAKDLSVLDDNCIKRVVQNHRNVDCFTKYLVWSGLRIIHHLTCGSTKYWLSLVTCSRNPKACHHLLRMIIESRYQMEPIQSVFSHIATHTTKSMRLKKSSRKCYKLGLCSLVKASSPHQCYYFEKGTVVGNCVSTIDC